MDTPSLNARRLQAPDLAKGIIMVLMALDHASFFIARIHYNEVWGVTLNAYDGTGWFLTRFITHLCAPGFFLLMGMGMWFFYRKKKETSWSENDIRKHFLQRGLLLILLPLILEFPAWGLGYITASPGVFAQHPEPGSSQVFYFACGVLFSLGSAMVISSFLLRTKPIWLLLILVAGYAFSYLLVSSEARPEESQSALLALLFFPGNHTGVFVKYSVFPWVFITLFGIIVGKSYQNFSSRSVIYIQFLLGILLLLAFVGIRMQNVGNFQLNTWDDLISFFTLIKYPPGPAFGSFTVGINLLILSSAGLIKEISKNHPLFIFGRTALFFYFIHLWVYCIIGLMFPNGARIELLYLLWMAGLIPIYFFCRMWLKFKLQTTEKSIWRLF